jgi:phenylalanyl-tRNA synthetase beta chain
VKLGKLNVSYTEIPKFPAVELDLSIQVGAATAWGDVERIVKEVAGNKLERVELFDLYHQDDANKSFGFHLYYRDPEKTLEMKDIEPIQKNIVDRLGKELGAKVRS